MTDNNLTHHEKRWRARAERYAVATIVEAKSMMANATKGRRAFALNVAAFSLAKLVAHELLSRKEAIGILANTELFALLVKENGLAWVDGAMLSALDSGIKDGDDSVPWEVGNYGG